MDVSVRRSLAAMAVRCAARAFAAAGAPRAASELAALADEAQERGLARVPDALDVWCRLAGAEMAGAHGVSDGGRWAAGLVAATAARLARTLCRPEPDADAVRVWAQVFVANSWEAGVTPPLALVLIAEGAPVADAVECAPLVEDACQPW